MPTFVHTDPAFYTDPLPRGWVPTSHIYRLALPATLDGCWLPYPINHIDRHFYVDVERLIEAQQLRDCAVCTIYTVAVATDQLQPTLSSGPPMNWSVVLAWKAHCPACGNAAYHRYMAGRDRDSAPTYVVDVNEPIRELVTLAVASVGAVWQGVKNAFAFEAGSVPPRPMGPEPMQFCVRPVPGPGNPAWCANARGAVEAADAEFEQGGDA